VITQEEFLERHVLVCNSENTQRPDGKRRGGNKRRHAKLLWKQCIKHDISPQKIVTHEDLKAALAFKDLGY
jgi:hypothetical protein